MGDVLVAPSWVPLAKIARPYLPEFGIPRQQAYVLLDVADRMTAAMFEELARQAALRDALIAAQWTGADL